jgi:hypothetical protein
MPATLTTHDPDSALTENQAADFLGVSVRTLQAWRVRGGGPRYLKIGRSVRYQRRELVAFQKAHTVSSTTGISGAAPRRCCRGYSNAALAAPECRSRVAIAAAGVSFARHITTPWRAPTTGPIICTRLSRRSCQGCASTWSIRARAIRHFLKTYHEERQAACGERGGSHTPITAAARRGH